MDIDGEDGLLPATRALLVAFLAAVALVAPASRAGMTPA